MSSHLPSANVTTDDQELLNLRQQSPHALPRPPGLPRAWRADLGVMSGYVFPWGYLVEMPNGLEDPDIAHGGGTSWRLLPTSLWAEVRAGARATCFHWHTLLAHVNCSATAILTAYVPDWLVCRVSLPHFLGELVAVGDRDAQRARCWLAGWLLPKYMDLVLRGYRDCLLESIASDFDFRLDAAIEEVTP
jgi:hypothetical protein